MLKQTSKYMKVEAAKAKAVYSSARLKNAPPHTVWTNNLSWFILEIIRCLLLLLFLLVVVVLEVVVVIVVKETNK